MLNFVLSITPVEYHNKIVYLFNHFHDDMLRFAKSRLRMAKDSDPTHNAEDIVQNCFLKISKYCESIKFENGYDYLKSYVMTIVAHETHKFIQKQKYFEELNECYEEAADDSLLEEMISEERYNEIVEVIKAMDEKYSIPLFYYFVDEISPKEISEILELPEKTVYTRIARGKVKLIEKLRIEVMK